MNKKILITILSLLSILILSCNASDKTGSGTTGGNGIKTYAGTWTLDIQNLKVVIVDDNNVTFDGEQMSSINKEGDGVYLIRFMNSKSGDIFLRLNFNNNTFELGPWATQQVGDQGTITKS